MKKQLSEKNMKASVSIGEELLIPYTESRVYGAFEDDKGEIYILIKNVKNPSKSIKLFFKEKDLEYEEIKDK
jgi:hypothetical protein